MELNLGIYGVVIKNSFKILYGDGAVMELDFMKTLRWWSWFKNVYGDGALMSWFYLDGAVMVSILISMQVSSAHINSRRKSTRVQRL